MIAGIMPTYTYVPTYTSCKLHEGWVVQCSMTWMYDNRKTCYKVMTDNDAAKFVLLYSCKIIIFMTLHTCLQARPPYVG